MINHNQRIVIYGCGGHSRSVAAVLLDFRQDLDLVFVDEKAKDGEKIFGFSVEREYQLNGEQVFFAIGDNEARDKYFSRMQNERIISIVSNKSFFGKDAIVSRGCFIGNFCNIGPEAVVGENTILNTASIIEHEVQIGHSCHIGPNAALSGRCNIGNLVFVGAGATIKDYILVCSGVTVGAGAVVVQDITEPGIYGGCPARKIK